MPDFDAAARAREWHWDHAADGFVTSTNLDALATALTAAYAEGHAAGVATERARAVKLIRAGCRHENHHGWGRETCPICRDHIDALRGGAGGGK